jgi:hypothetical protein
MTTALAVSLSCPATDAHAITTIRHETPAIAIFAAHHMMLVILKIIHDGLKVASMATDPIVIRNSGQETS